MAVRGHTLWEQQLGAALAAAIAALRAYQYGNGSPELAKSIADAGVAAMRGAHLEQLLIGIDAR